MLGAPLARQCGVRNAEIYVYEMTWLRRHQQSMRRRCLPRLGSYQPLMQILLFVDKIGYRDPPWSLVGGTSLIWQLMMFDRLLYNNAKKTPTYRTSYGWTIWRACISRSGGIVKTDPLSSQHYVDP